MRGAIDATGEEELIMDYLRHACCVLYGHTREREIFERIEGATRGSADSVLLLTQLADMAQDYCAILNPDHPKWIGFKPAIRNAIRTINLLRVEQLLTIA